MTTRPGDQRFYRLLDEIANLHAKKSQDYSPAADPLKNFRASADYGVRPYLGVLTRLGDKAGRIATFARSGELQNESARDSHIDSAVYHLIAVLLLEDEAEAKAADHLYDAFTEPPMGCMGDPDPVPVTVAGSDEPTTAYVLDEPFPAFPPPQFGPGSPAATTASGAARVYVGEDESPRYHPV